MIKYYPILKKGNSEVKALEEALNQKSNLGEEVLPIIEAPQKSNPENWERDFNTFGRYLHTKIPDLNFAFQYSTAFAHLDDQAVSNWKSSFNNNIVEFIHSRIVEYHPNYIPCFNYDDSDWIIDSISPNFESVIIRIEPYKFASGLDNVIISGVISKFTNKFPNQKIIWLVDFYNKFNDLQRASSIIHQLNQSGQVIFAATSCPEDANAITHSNFSVASTRNDLFSYKTLKDTFMDLAFSDYTVRLKPNPGSEGINMNNTYLKIFYTTDTEYMIAKSGLIKHQGADSTHYTIEDTCKLIVQSPSYFGKSFSWGDKKIKECADNTFEIHTHQVPIQIGINHHIFSTLKQL
ncbi:MAG: hypothetical protein Q6A85_11065 [Enterococcus mundtii]|nr:hypothetical protein [Enterococcus mundtii]